MQINKPSSNLTNSLVFGVVLAAAATCVVAGNGGTEFNAVYDMLSDWATGTLGKIIALSALIVGIGLGLVRQSVIAAVIGIAMALVLNFGPVVIDGILTATGEGADMAAIAMLTNGLGL